MNNVITVNGQTIWDITPGVTFQQPMSQSHSDPANQISYPKNNNVWQAPPPRPEPKPIVQEVITFDSITADIDRTGEAFLAARKEYEANRGKDLYGEEIGKIAAELAVLEPRVKVLRDRLRELESKPTPEAKFVQDVVNASREVLGCGRKTAAYIYERFSQKIFGYPYARLRDEENTRIVKWNAQAIEPYKVESIALTGVETPKSCDAKIDGLLEKLTAIHEILNKLEVASSK
jgi:hypothetical protein